MKPGQVVDVLFQSGWDYLRYYADFFAAEGSEGWVYLGKPSDTNAHFAASFKVTQRQSLPNAKVVAAELVLFDTQRLVEPGHRPMKFHGAAFIVDAGGRRYVFEVDPRPDDRTLQDLAAAVATFKETAGAPSPSQPIQSSTNQAPPGSRVDSCRR
jgi:hypothetical protein